MPTLRRAAALIATAPIAAALLAAAPCVAAPPLAPTAPPTAGHAVGDVFQRGVCYAHAWRGDGGYGSDTSARTLAHLHDDGVGWISLTPFGYLPSERATEIRVVAHPRGESDERLHVEVERAHALGMKVALKPHLWVRGGAWQGALAWDRDEDFRRFMASYRDFLLHYAALAARDRYDLLVVGTELKSATLRDPAAWRALVADVRRVYRGPLTYAANWDEAERVTFWDALDAIGVDAYYPLATHAGASEAELTAAWQSVAARLEALSRRCGRPILLTELGYRAATDAALDPATWPESDPDRGFAPEHQAACYRAALSALWGRPWLAGIYVWKWFSDDRDEAGPTDFSPSGKPAESVLRGYYRRPFRAP